MKKILVLCFLFIGINTINAQELKWYDNFEEAVKVSQKTKKPILANFTGSDWCGWCIRLDREVFSTKEFKEWAKKNVILLTVDFPKRKRLPENITEMNNALQRAFQVRGYPTIWLFNIGKGEDPTKGLEPLAKTGYVRGGAEKWINSVDPYLPKKS